MLLAASGESVPCTTETPTPAFSKTLPPCKTRLVPPPPSGRSQLSLVNWAPPSRAAMRLHSVSWVARSIDSMDCRIDSVMSLSFPVSRG